MRRHIKLSFNVWRICFDALLSRYAFFVTTATVLSSMLYVPHFLASKNLPESLGFPQSWHGYWTWHDPCSLCCCDFSPLPTTTSSRIRNRSLRLIRRRSPSLYHAEPALSRFSWLSHRR